MQGEPIRDVTRPHPTPLLSRSLPHAAPTLLSASAEASHDQMLNGTHTHAYAVLPDCRIQNFTSDWNSGVYLSALLDYCKPGLFTTWKNLNPRNSIPNCKQAMEIAKAEFNIPMILEPEILASPYLDELSGMTYLSYFMKEGGPGYKATLDWVRKQLPDRKINNFTRDWNDGMNLTTLVKQLGGPVPGYKRLRPDPDSWESNLQLGIDGGRKLGVEPVLSAGEMSRPDVESLANMGYIAYYQWVRPRQSPADSMSVKCDLDNVRVNNPIRELDQGPSSLPGRPFTFVVDATRCGWGDATVDVTQGGRSLLSRSLEIDRGLYEVTFTPLEAAKHKIYAYFNGHEVKGSPFSLYLGIERPPDRKDSKAKKKTSSKEGKTSKEVKEIVKEYSGSSLLNSPRYSSSSNDSPYKSSTLTRTYDSNTQSKVYETSAVNRSVNSSITKSSPDKSYDSKNDSPSKAFDSSVSKGSSSYEAINNKYVNFESSTIVSRSSTFDSSKKHSSSYDVPHSKISHEDFPSKKGYEMPTSARKSLTFEPSPATSPTKSSSYSKSTALDSSYNSSFDSTFKTSTSTVINTNKSSLAFNKAASPTRLSSPRKSTSPSPPHPPSSGAEDCPCGEPPGWSSKCPHRPLVARQGSADRSECCQNI
ncbi:Filamin-A [Penaeus vannamei]|uniref:Filamin-A n=1 Tax=Penaeus vannamei TaxID=6689 RepID=A0A3R7M1E3_PENVA|nr:Filamin-A [Penaeus vannamei]